MQNVVPCKVDILKDMVVMDSDATVNMRGFNCSIGSLMDYEFSKEFNRVYRHRKRNNKYPIFSIEYDSRCTCIYYEIVRVENPNAKIINFCGLSIDMSTLDIVLGLFPDKEYIKLFSFKDLFNYIVFGKCNSDKLSYEDIVYFVETIKFYGDRGNVLEQLKKVISDKIDYSISESYSSVVINCVKRKSKEYESSAGDDNLGHLNSYTSEGAFLYSLFYTCTNVSRKLEDVASSLFKNFIIEDSISEVINNIKIPTSGLIDTGVNSKNLETLRLRYLNRGLPDILVDSLISYGFGLNKRKSLYKEALNGGITAVNRSLLAFNSMCYVEVYSSGNLLLEIPATKARCYSILDMLRAVGWEQDLIFSYEVEKDFQNKILVEHIFNKFQLSEVLDSLNISYDDFRSFVFDYQSRYMYLVDYGAMYARKVRKSQYAMGTFCKPMIINSGKVFEKISSRLLNKF